MKIVFVNQHMKMGGIANALYNTINLLKKETDWDISLVVFSPYFDDKFKDLNHIKTITPFWLKFLYIPKKEALKKLPAFHLLLFFITKAIAKTVGMNRSRLFFINRYQLPEKYDAAISFTNDIPKNKVITGANDFVLKSIRTKQKIAWIHNDLDKLGFDRPYVLKRYKDFDKIVNVSLGCQKQFEELVPEYAGKSYRVTNYIDKEIIREKARAFKAFEKNDNRINLVTVARMDNQQKRIDRILKIAAQLKKQKFNFKWTLIGSGPDLDRLKNESEKSGLSDVLIFKGFQQNPYPYMQQADLFVLTSDYEAQGMVLTESILLKTPVITTDFSAAYEFVKPGKNGLIVEKDWQSIYKTLENLLKNPENLKKLQENTRKEDLDIKTTFWTDLKKLLSL